MWNQQRNRKEAKSSENKAKANQNEANTKNAVIPRNNEKLTLKLRIKLILMALLPMHSGTL
jgi:hypothetical protein